MDQEKKIIKKLGLDLGTNSIGWCILDFNEKENRYNLVDLGVRLWKKSGEKAERRQHRMARRQRKHLKSRLRKLEKFLNDAKLSIIEKKQRGLCSLFKLRVKALDQPLSPEELREILFHIAKNRGFKGSELEIEKQEKEQKGFKKILTETEENVKKTARSYSEWLIKTNQPKLRLRGDADKKPQHYPTRKLIKEEFNAIRSTQEPITSFLDWDKLEDILFFQRGLSIPYIGKCSIYSNEERLAKDDPLAIEYVMLENLSHITLSSKSIPEFRGLTKEEIHEAKESLKDQKEMTVNSLLKHLQLQKDYTIKRKDEIKEKAKITGLKARPSGYLNLSKKAIKEILERFETSNHRIGEIIADLRKETIKETPISDHLKYYGEVMSDVPNFYIIPPCRCANSNECLHKVGKDERKWGITPNGIHHAAFNQIRQLINAIIKKHGKIDEIIIELIRSDWEPEKADQIRKKNEKLNEEIKKRLEAGGKPVTKETMTKGQLFMELEKESINTCCPYCDQRFGWESVFSSDIQIEHVIPYSKTKSNNFSYLLLAHRSCNDKKGNKTPYEAFGQQEIYDQMIQRTPESKRWMFASNALEKFTELTDGWLPNSLVNTSTIAKHARKYLSSITNKVYATRGSLTADLRRHFKLKKNRQENHEHHAIDAFCVALISPKILQKISRYSWAESKFEDVLFNNEQELIHQLKEKKIVISRKINHALQGAIVEQTAYGIYPNTPNEYYRAKAPTAKKSGKAYESVDINSAQMVEIDGKGYKSAQYAYADLWQNIENPTEIIWEFKTLRDALDIQSGKKTYCQPSNQKGKWRKLLRLRKGDYLENSKKELFFVAQFNPSSNRILIADPKEINSQRKEAKKRWCVGKSFFKDKWHLAHVDILGNIKVTPPRWCV
jgi:CRISPR-associated endonuclease Csn1